MDKPRGKASPRGCLRTVRLLRMSMHERGGHSDRKPCSLEAGETTSLPGLSNVASCAIRVWDVSAHLSALFCLCVPSQWVAGEKAARGLHHGPCSLGHHGSRAGVGHTVPLGSQRLGNWSLPGHRDLCGAEALRLGSVG